MEFFTENVLKRFVHDRTARKHEASMELRVAPVIRKKKLAKQCILIGFREDGILDSAQKPASC